MTLKLPRGFEAAGVHCGIKSDASKEDLTLLHCPEDAVAAGVYTRNLVFAAPVALDRERTPTDRFRVLVVNSGNANACTGQRGNDDARRMAELAARSVGADPDQALVMSTGIIGEFLPMEKIAAGVLEAAEQLGAGTSHAEAAARGILTTDKGPKTASATIDVGGGETTVSVFAKGAGMIGPRMATMLGVIATDAVLTPEQADRVLRRAVDASFNRISVDSHTSTNDTVLLIASGKSPSQLTAEADVEIVAEEIEQLCIQVAKMIPDDGEGATHLMQVAVEGADCDETADRIARRVGDSPLVKTAVSGADPNWGRIVSAAGCADAQFDAAELRLWVQDQLLYDAGEPVAFEEAEVSRLIRESRDVAIRIQVGSGPGNAVYWASDLTCDYVTFNADYHT